MASVRLDFAPPLDFNAAVLHILESPTSTGVFTEIEAVTNVGAPPDYISSYTTNEAGSVDHWFAIQWEDDKGALSEVSNPIEGGTKLLLNEIVQRVMLRDSSLKENVVIEEAETAIFNYQQEDPYNPSLTADYRVKRGLTNLTLAMCYLTAQAQTASTEYVAGIVSQKTSDTAIKNRQDSVKKLLEMAGADLGQAFSLIAQMKENMIAGGLSMNGDLDQSRLLVEIR